MQVQFHPIVMTSGQMIKESARAYSYYSISRGMHFVSPLPPAFPSLSRARDQQRSNRSLASTLRGPIKPELV